MRHFLSVLLALLLLAPAALAADPVDLSALTFDELVALREQLNLAIWNSQEWQEVTVPAGTWEIGKDIPAGHWSIRAAGDRDINSVAYHDLVDETGHGVAPGWSGWNGLLTGPDCRNQEHSSVDLDMAEGMFFTCGKPVIFTPFAGKPDLGFKSPTAHATTRTALRPLQDLILTSAPADLADISVELSGSVLAVYQVIDNHWEMILSVQDSDALIPINADTPVIVAHFRLHQEQLPVAVGDDATVSGSLNAMYSSAMIPSILVETINGSEDF